MKLHSFRLTGKLLPATFLLIGVLSLAVAPATRAAPSFTISPVAGHADQYTFAVTDGGFSTTAGADASIGDFTTNSEFFDLTSGQSSTATFGGVITTSSSGIPPEPNLTGISISGDTFGLTFASNLMGSGTSYGMAGSTTTTFSGGDYSHLIPGTYTITSGSGIFANSSNYGGTLTVQAAAVPEPATYAAVMGLVVLGFALWRRRGRKLPA